MTARNNTLREFAEGDASVLVISPAGSTGLNIASANILIIVVGDSAL
jgi:SNF2 family DNA or RNA helicase